MLIDIPQEFESFVASLVLALESSLDNNHGNVCFIR